MQLADADPIYEARVAQRGIVPKTKRLTERGHEYIFYERTTLHKW